MIGVLMAAWSSGQQVFAARRAAGRRAATGYELPFVLAGGVGRDGRRHAVAVRHRRGLAAPGGCSGSCLAMVIFFAAGLAELRRPPFDMPVADAELVFGPYTEYTGLRFALFLLAEYAGIVVLAALTTVLFLGGWKGPFDDQLGWLWTLVKVFAVAFVVIWLRVAYPRLREDQLQRLAWLGLVPLALLQLAITAAVKVASETFGTRGLPGQGSSRASPSRSAR